MKKLKIKLIVDNIASGALLGEHGLSTLVEYDNNCILFDTGQGYCLKHNMRQLGINPERITDLVISHGHYDHTGGIGVLLEDPFCRPKIYIHPAVLEEKYAKESDGPKYIGISEKNKNLLLQEDRNLFSSKTSSKITPLIAATGEIPLKYPEENLSSRFYCDRSLTKPDLLPDDQAIFIRSAMGIIVILGCCHRGLGNTLEHIKFLSGSDDIFAVIGGTHLRNVNDSRLDFTIDIIRKFGISYFRATHCIGFYAAAYLKHALPDIFNMGHTGEILEFNL